jgi:putative transcriptional regulator
LEKGKYNPSLKLAHDIAGVLKSIIEDVFIFEEEPSSEGQDSEVYGVATEK